MNKKNLKFRRRIHKRLIYKIVGQFLRKEIMNDNRQLDLNILTEKIEIPSPGYKHVEPSGRQIIVIETKPLSRRE